MPGTASTPIDTFSDSELTRRLTQRGHEGPYVESLVRNREDTSTASEIATLLGLD